MPWLRRRSPAPTEQHFDALVKDLVGRAEVSPEVIGELVTVVAQYENSFGGHHRAVLKAQETLILLLVKSKRFDEAIARAEKVVSSYVEVGPSSPHSLRARRVLGWVYLSAGQADRAVATLEPLAAQVSKRFGNDRAATHDVALLLGAAYDSARRYDDAIGQLEPLVSDSPGAFRVGTEHQAFANVGLAQAFWLSGRCAVSEEIGRRCISLTEQAIDSLSKKRGPDREGTLKARYVLASATLAAGRPREALEQYERLETDCQRALGEDHPLLHQTLCQRGDALIVLGRYQEACMVLEPLLERRQASGDDLVQGRPPIHGVRNALASARFHSGDHQRAIEDRRRLLDELRGLLGADDPRVIKEENNLAHCLARSGRPAEAIQIAENAVRRIGALLGEDHPQSLLLRQTLGEAYRRAGRASEATEILQSIANSRVLGSPKHPSTFNAQAELAACYAAGNKTADALILLSQVVQGRLEVLGPEHPETIKAQNDLRQLQEPKG